MSTALEDTTVAELQEAAQYFEIEGRSQMNKSELISAIREVRGDLEALAEDAPETEDPVARRIDAIESRLATLEARIAAVDARTRPSSQILGTST